MYTNNVSKAKIGKLLLYLTMRAVSYCHIANSNNDVPSSCSLLVNMQYCRFTPVYSLLWGHMKIQRQKQISDSPPPELSDFKLECFVESYMLSCQLQLIAHGYTCTSRNQTPNLEIIPLMLVTYRQRPPKGHDIRNFNPEETSCLFIYKKYDMHTKVSLEH